MGPVDVRPESIHLAAQRVDGAGQDWGASVGTLSADMGAVVAPYGGDELGTALKEMYQIIGPTALEYFTETGFCLEGYSGESCGSCKTAAELRRCTSDQDR